MANGCVNGNLDDANYSSPVPIIGLYIAAGTLVCLVLMLFDIISAIRHRQNWIPCRYFSLNSVTLTLLSIVSKVPVDLTTPMPGVHDQLSKLTSTTSICICVAFMGPSIASSSGSEYKSNLAALTILIVTIVVNVCIQLSTGVIYVFIVEHVIIMCFLLLFPLFLWYSAYQIKGKSETYLERYRGFVTGKEAGSTVFQRLKLCYMYCFDDNPQLKTCMNPNYYIMAWFSIFSFCILIQATVRSFVLQQLKVCGGESDYGWSMWIVVVVQILSIVVGCFATSYRGFTFLARGEYAHDSEYGSYALESAYYVIRRNPILGANPWHKICICLQAYGWQLNLLAKKLIMVPTKAAWKAYYGTIQHKDIVLPQWVRSELRRVRLDVDIWAAQKVVNDIERWKERKTIPLKNISHLLSRTQASSLSVEKVELKSFMYPGFRTMKVCSLAMSLLVKLSTCCMPCKRTQFLEDCMDESHEILHFIETRTNCNTASDRNRSELTKAVLIGAGFDIYLPQIISSYGDVQYHSLSQLDRALLILQQLPGMIRMGAYIHQATTDVIQLINLHQHDTDEDLYNHMEEIFASMLRICLSQLPKAILKEMSGSSLEGLSYTTRRVFKYLFDIETIEAQVQWSFPMEYYVTSLITPLPQGPGPSLQNETVAEDHAHVAKAEDEDGNVSSFSDENVVPEIEEIK